MDRDELIRTLRSMAGKPMTAAEMDAQRRSFVRSMTDAPTDVVDLVLGPPPDAANVAALKCRITRAVAILTAAPDPHTTEMTKRVAQDIADANQRAWVVLTEGMDPPSVRRAEEAP